MPSYDTSVPAASDTLAATQLPIQTNFSTIYTDFSLDHYPFAATSEGLHKQITFAGNNVPSTPASTTTSYGYTNIVSPQTTSQLYFLNSGGTSYQLTNLLSSCSAGTLSTGSGGSPTVGSYIAFITPWGFKIFLGTETTAATGSRVNYMFGGSFAGSALTTFGSTIYYSGISVYGGSGYSDWTPTVSVNYGTVITQNSNTTRWIVISN